MGICFSETFLLSRILFQSGLFSGHVAGNTTVAATTGPQRQPRPHSSMQKGWVSI